VIAVFGCETARELLESFVDGELSTSQQVAVQSHIRTCPTCAARVEDMSLIAWSIRSAPFQDTDDDARALAVLQSGVLARVRAEREQSFKIRFRNLFSDMRLFWPALGATTAVLLCLYGAANVWRLTTEKRPNSLAAQLETLENPGSDRNPLRLDDAVSAPRVLHDGLALEGMPEGDGMVAVRALVTQGGRVGEAELLDLNVPDVTAVGTTGFSDGRDVLNAVRTWQLAPAQSRTGRPIAVMVVYLFAQTTAVKESARAFETVPGRRIIRPVVEPVKVPAVPAGTTSSVELSLTTA